MSSRGDTTTERVSFLARRYGGKKAFVKTGWHAMRLGLGAYREYRHVQWQQVSRLVFVCKGNICRSAFAHHRLVDSGMPIASAGLDATTGTPANGRAILVAERLGANLQPHRSTHIAELTIEPGDLFIGFEPWHGEALQEVAARHPGTQVTLLGLWSASPSAYLQDPYGLPEPYFETCFMHIDAGLQGLISYLKTPVSTVSGRHE